MRLIDADELKEELSQQWFIDILLTKTNSNDMYSALAEKIDSQPTAYEEDKVLKQLEDEKSHISLLDDELEVYKSAIDDAIEIVKEGGMNNNSKTSD